MGKAVIPGAGGGGAGSDECTATRAEVLKGYKAITKESDDELIAGTLALTGTAADSQVLSGQTYYNTDPKTRRTGNMVNRGAVSQALNAGAAYTIPAGYHNGSGKVTANGLAGQTGGSATAGQILSGQTAWVNGNKVTGSMANQGNKTAALNCGGSYTIPAGYHSGSGKVVANSLASQTGGVTADDGKVLSGSTYWRDGVKRTGNMPNRGGYQGTGNSSGNDAGNRRFYVNIPNGYYDNNAPVLLPWDRVKSWIGLTPDKIRKGVQIMDVTGIAEGYVPSATDLYYRGNNPANWHNFMTDTNASFDAGQISIGLHDSELGKLVTMVRLRCDPIRTVGYHYLNIEVSSFTLNSVGTHAEGAIEFSIGGAQAAVYGNRENYTGVITLDLGSVQAEGAATLTISKSIIAQSGYVRGAIHRIWLS